MSNAKQIVAMLRSRAKGDDEQFYSIALQIAAAEARQGRKTVAEELRAAVDDARGLASAGASVAIPFARPRGDLESLIELKGPQIRLRDVVLHDRVRRQIQEVVRQQLKRDWLREHGKTPNRRILFVGPPGSGKTMTAEALASDLKLPLFVIRLEGLITRYMGETAAKLRLVFDESTSRRGVYLFDEFDAVGGRRNATNDVAEMRRVLNSFLQFMEEPNTTDSLIIGATNHPELLDRALQDRRGGPPWPVRHVPIGRGGGAKGSVPENPALELMICDAPLRRPGESTAMRKVREICVWMAKNRAECQLLAPPTDKNRAMKGNSFQWRCNQGIIAINLRAIREMSVDEFDAVGGRRNSTMWPR